MDNKEKRKKILQKAYDMGFKYIARDATEICFFYEDKPIKINGCWTTLNTNFNSINFVACKAGCMDTDSDSLFDDIKWDDNEPFKFIKELGNEEDTDSDVFKYSYTYLRSQKEEPLKHDDHYKALGIEPWDILEANMTHEEFKGFLKGNIQKYLHRNKEGLKDYEKLLNYAQKLVEVEKKHGNDNQNNNDK